MDSIEIGMGKLYIADGPVVLSTSGIGSCVAVCLWCQIQKKGSLAHIMLPRRPINNTGEIVEDDFRYGDISIQAMVQQLETQDVKRTNLIAKIVGGAEMFPGLQARSQQVGARNVEAVKQTLDVLHIPIAAEETGGNVGRAVTFDVSNGIVTIRMTI
ncbi:MAG: putative chemoreceptor glutamine deamidase CheD [candidate division CPR2 bacterium GW2011_GWC1_39_9]|uniref:Probable chemoreceptor glutamine deamidase CheD n=1 Tax=candidate division CPR2 bacterium GW2011_GWC2_39_10 TaxID=1618345 RepID=A0A0G0Q1A2_UNCC2|nr:MAG: putative chemoreceptor glutamine deamidase CheD [candidate division CPR2 bacterium GW2011_GWC2_39_10]KKR36212.1 MAG: putative chemoreceptor glutamine deamidase CheD [candidate division CPR2 bacterium GW2011_GWC1_39_9]